MDEYHESDRGEITDGYHTFNELYAHRTELFITLCYIIASEGPIERSETWKSRLHSDGTKLDGWFIAGIGREAGGQITYHLPDAKWDDLDIPVWERAPVYDGHTSADVLGRLRRLR